MAASAAAASQRTVMLKGFQTFLFIYAFLSMCVYAFMIFSIFKQRKHTPILRGSFFRLIVFHFVADFMMFLEFNLLMRARKYGYLNAFFVEGSSSHYIVPRISNALHYYAKTIVYIGQVIFAVNRLTSALVPLNYNTVRYLHMYTTMLMMWSKWRVRWVVGAQWIVSLAAVLPVHLNMHFTMKYVKYEKEDTLRLVTDKSSTEIIAYIDMGISVLCTLLSLCLYCATIYVIRSSLKNKRTTKPNRVQAVELRLLVCAFVVFSVLTLNTIIQVMIVITNKIGLEQVMFINDLSYPMVDLTYTCQPWALLICSSVIRESVMATIGWQPRHSPIPPLPIEHCEDHAKTADAV